MPLLTVVAVVVSIVLPGTGVVPVTLVTSVGPPVGFPAGGVTPGVTAPAV